jgi:hypothetical protein
MLCTVYLLLKLLNVLYSASSALTAECFVQCILIKLLNVTAGNALCGLPGQDHVVSLMCKWKGLGAHLHSDLV